MPDNKIESDPSDTRAAKRKLSFGPALLVTAAFIGPGTVFTASKTGAVFGYTLLWAVLFAVFAAIVLQEMSARLGVISGAGLSDAIRTGFDNVVVRWAMLILVLAAILFGNAAYQTGNLVGAATGLDVLTGVNFKTWVVVLAVVALIVIWIGRLDLLQYLLTALVGIMSLLFIFAAFICKPDLGAIGSGLVPTSLPEGADWKLIVGLIGTTVVPYNLFLHASSAAEKWHGDQTVGLTDDQAKTAIRESRLDTVIALSIGGIITASILITAAAAFSLSLIHI